MIRFNYFHTLTLITNVCIIKGITFVQTWKLINQILAIINNIIAVNFSSSDFLLCNIMLSNCVPTIFIRQIVLFCYHIPKKLAFYKSNISGNFIPDPLLS